MQPTAMRVRGDESKRLSSAGQSMRQEEPDRTLGAVGIRGIRDTPNASGDVRACIELCPYVECTIGLYMHSPVYLSHMVYPHAHKRVGRLYRVRRGSHTRMFIPVLCVYITQLRK